MCPNDYLIVLLCCIIILLILFPNALAAPPNKMDLSNLNKELNYSALNPVNWFKSK